MNYIRQAKYVINIYDVDDSFAGELNPEHCEYPLHMLTKPMIGYTRLWFDENGKHVPSVFGVPKNVRYLKAVDVKHYEQYTIFTLRLERM